MSLETSPGQPQSRWARFRTYVTAPGVLSWGVPSAVGGTIWLHGREHGVSWASFAMPEFWVRLVVYVVIVGILGGRAFGRTLARFTPRDSRGSGPGSPPA